MKIASVLTWLAKCIAVFALAAAIVVAYSSGFYFGYLDGYDVGHEISLNERIN